ncbi:MAG: bifunctional riboflavin kinase/FAD synthetase [Gammaproteobacteria bacterium]|nr:bifunctional riboflavin kinase/FAD synthetase [Gammaproteobacteria bacterium]
MELIRGLYNLKAQHKGCVATIGTFDGVHLGHQVVLQALRENAASMALPSVVMTFEPQPQEYFAPATAPPRLTRLREKAEIIADHGITRVVCLRFNHRLASLSAEQFVRNLLVDGMGVRRLVVGDDFRFGKGREGDYSKLCSLGEAMTFSVTATPTCIVDGERVSSTRVRRALVEGDLELARRLLARRYSISGRVAHGDERGRTLGFPTANIELHRLRSPLHGVFAARVEGIVEKALAAVAYIGTRPVINGKRELLEVHIFDFDEIIYGRYVRVSLCQRIRAERSFASIATLQKQIAEDIQQAKAFFASKTNCQQVESVRWS